MQVCGMYVVRLYTCVCVYSIGRNDYLFLRTHILTHAYTYTDTNRLYFTARTFCTSKFVVKITSALCDDLYRLSFLSVSEKSLNTQHLSITFWAGCPAKLQTKQSITLHAFPSFKVEVQQISR